MKESVWTASTELPQFPKLEGDKTTDVLVIGGGLCGILCAYYLKKAGVDCILVEGGKIASGVTGNTTAKITSQHGLIYAKLLQTLGKDMAQRYLAANQTALAEYKTLCQTIDCDFAIKPAYTYSMTSREKIQTEVDAVNALGFPAQFKERLELPFQTRGAICFPDQAQFHPLKFIRAIADGLPIYENTFIRDLTPTTAVADSGKITAKKIIVATHFPFLNKHGSYFLKLYQHRSYVSAYAQAQPLDGMYVDEDSKGLSFRTHHDLLLIGGGSHRTGKHGGAWNAIHHVANAYYPAATLSYEWATQDCMSLDAIPYIGKYSARTPNLYVASGFHKWGMTSSMVAANILCDMVQEKENDFAPVFSPQRSMLKPQLLRNGLEATVNLLTPTTKRCPHLGCALKWNRYEHSWDCPCHGSRFTQDGICLNNPANGDTNFLKRRSRS